MLRGGETMRHIRGGTGARLPDVRPSSTPRVHSRLAGLVATVDAQDRRERTAHAGNTMMHRADEAFYGSRPGQRHATMGGREMWQRGRNDGGFKAITRKLRNMDARFKPWQ